jgi:hypothetical protein
MASDDEKRLLELQIEALKKEHVEEKEEEEEQNRIPKNARSANNAKLAKLYEDTAEYEIELASFQEEFEIISQHDFNNIIPNLKKELPNHSGDYAVEIKDIIINAWTHYVKIDKTHKEEELDTIKQTNIEQLINTFNSTYQRYENNFEDEIKNILIARWKMLIEIKQEHIKDELADMKLQGMKPNHIKRVYKNYHGIID